MTDSIRPLHLMGRKRKRNEQVHRLQGAPIGKLAAKSSVHTVHQHAMHTLYTEIVRHPPVWSKGSKYANMTLTPLWVHTALQESVHSICIAGFCAWRQTNDAVEIAPPGSVSLKFADGKWTQDDDNTGCNATQWTIIMVDPPIRHSDGSTTLNSCVANAINDTLIYDEMYENIRRRDFFNSRPAVFTVVDKTLRNQNGSSKQWFQQQTSGATAASRINAVDSNFQTLVQNRATSIRRLEETSLLARERMNTPTKLAGAKESLEKKETKMQHTEHMVTDGKDVVPSRTLMSLTDGFQMLNQTMYNIMFHFHVPPQLLGRNINAERTGVNPRLNEMVLQSFFTSTTRLRHQLQRMFAGLKVSGAEIRFQPTISPFELETLHDKIEPAQLPQMYGMAYHVPEELFSIQSKAAVKAKPREGAPQSHPAESTGSTAGQNAAQNGASN